MQRLSVLVVLSVLAGACTTGARQPEILDRVPDAAMNRRQVRQRCLDFMDRFTTQVERAADRIAAEARGDEEAVRLERLDSSGRREELTWRPAPVKSLRLRDGERV